MYCRLIPGLTGFLCAAILLAGCSTLPQLGAPITAYAPTTIFTPEGYGQTKIDDTHFQVQATGTEATPKERVERIARARAAQIGVEAKQKYFKVTSTQHGVACKKRRESYKGEATAPSSRPTVVLDVVYSQTQSDPEFADAETAFTQMKADLTDETVGPEARAAAAQETRSSCGEGSGA